MPPSDSGKATELLFGMGALMSDLKRLEATAMSQGFLIAATLIGAAAEAVADEMGNAADPPKKHKLELVQQMGDMASAKGRGLQ